MENPDISNYKPDNNFVYGLRMLRDMLAQTDTPLYPTTLIDLHDAINQIIIKELRKTPSNDVRLKIIYAATRILEIPEKLQASFVKILIARYKSDPKTCIPEDKRFLEEELTTDECLKVLEELYRRGMDRNLYGFLAVTPEENSAIKRFVQIYKQMLRECDTPEQMKAVEKLVREIRSLGILRTILNSKIFQDSMPSLPQ